MSTMRAIAVAMIVGVSACAGNKMETAVPRAEIFGEWQLDRAASDSLRQGLDIEGRERRGGIRVGGRIPGPGGRPEVLGGMGGAAEMRRVTEAWARGNERIALAGADGVVSVEYADGTKLQLVANGKKLKHPFRDNDAVESRAKWKDGRLEIEHKLERVRITETYSRAPDSPKLIVTTIVKGGVPRPMEFRRVYLK